LKFEVPDSFAALIEKLNEFTASGRVIELLRWAMANPAEATRTSDEYWKLGRNAKSHFREMVFSYNPRTPTEALKASWEIQKEQHVQRKILSKALAGARGNGHVILMPSGIRCVTTKLGDKYLSAFIVQNVQITLVLGGQGIAEYFDKLQKGEVYGPAVDKVQLDKTTYDSYGDVGQIIIKAINTNTNPYISAVLRSANKKEE
jgi:hypothetical protein